MAVALGGMTGILKQVVYKISEENAEKCVLLELTNKGIIKKIGNTYKYIL